MFHDVSELRAIALTRPAAGQSQAVAAVEAFCSIGVESALLSKRLFDNTQKLCRSAAMHKDAKDVSRTMGAFVNESLPGHRAKRRGRSRHLGAFSPRRQFQRVFRLNPGCRPALSQTVDPAAWGAMTGKPSGTWGRCSEGVPWVASAAADAARE